MKKINEAEYICGESPIWDTEGKRLLWVDNEGGGVYSFDPKDGKTQTLFDDVTISCIALCSDGGLVCGARDGIYLWRDGNLDRLMESFAGKILSCNDSAADPAGRFLFGTTYYDGSGDYPLGCLYAMDTDGSVRRLEEGLHLSNGIGFSPDGSTIYYTDTVLRTVYKARYDIPTGTLSQKEVFIRLPESAGIPDGLTVDSDGNIWIAQWFGGCISCYSAQGALKETIPVPARQVTSLAFGGEKLDIMYITSASLYEEMDIAPLGYDYAAGYRGGPVYFTRAQAVGKEEYRVNIG